MNSKQKGARGERELSSKLKEYGYETRRGQQYCGANGDADVVGLPGIHIVIFPNYIIFKCFLYFFHLAKTLKIF